MLSEEIHQEVQSAIDSAPTPGAACLDVLRIVQSHFGWISDELLRDVADLLGMTPEEVDSRSTFYNHIYRKPVGRHIVLVCDSITCWIMGYESILGHLIRRLGVEIGGTTKDNRFTVLPIQCLGACDRAPAIMIDGDLHGDLTPQKVDSILENYP
jgi:NADH-quinone oxidoreductase subunit E